MPSLLTHAISIEYLTGLKSSHAYILRTGPQNYLFTDGRYLEHAKNLATASKRPKKSRQNDSTTHPRLPFPVTVIDTADLKNRWPKLLKKHRIRTLEYEAEHLTLAEWDYFKKISHRLHWIPGARDVIQSRSIKTPEEIRHLQKSQQINEQIFSSIKRILKHGITELEVAQAIKRMAFEKGADQISFEPIIGFGENSSVPHHQNTTRKLKKGDLVLIDMGVFYRGYASDMTRMLFTKAPTPEQEKIYNLVLAAQNAAIRAMKPGTPCAKLDAIARNILAKGNHERDFLHSLGHGVGMEIHEAPTLSQRSQDTLKTGMVVTSEPGVYLPQQFGIRIEDMILITSDGHRNMTKAPKALRDCILK